MGPGSASSNTPAFSTCEDEGGQVRGLPVRVWTPSLPPEASQAAFQFSPPPAALCPGRANFDWSIPQEAPPRPHPAAVGD